MIIKAIQKTMDKFEYFRNKYDISRELFALDLFIIAGIIVLSFAIFTTERIPVVAEVIAPPKVLSTNMFDNLKLKANAVYVYDFKNKKVVFEKNSTAQLPLASLTKLATALTAIELLPKDSEITIKKEFLAEEGDSGLLANESWKLKDLLDFSLVTSSNDGARSIASVIGAFDLKTDDYNLGRKDFISKMNAKVQEIGLKQTYFINESGLDVSDTTSGGYGSAQDMGNLIGYIVSNEPDVIEATKYRTFNVDSDTKEHVAKNTNSNVSNIPGLILSKTGYTNLAGGNLAIAFDPTIGRPVVIVVLGSTIDGRFDDMDELVKATLEYVKQ